MILLSHVNGTHKLFNSDYYLTKFLFKNLWNKDSIRFILKNGEIFGWSLENEK